MIFSKKKKVLSAMLSLAMIGTMVASVPFTASADTTTTTPDVGVSYSTQIQSIGWQTAVTDGALSGTVGQAKRLEAIKINLTNAPAGASITYKTQVQTFGWQTEVSDGTLSGTVGKAKRLEGIKITLTGLAGYSVQYQTQVQTYGWQTAVTTKNGTAIDSAALSGTQGQAKRLEAIKIKIVKDPVTAVTVTKVAATSATTLAVTFSSAPADTSKVVFAVKNSSSTAMTTTTTWNTDKTVATLTLGYSFPADTYSVAVTNDTTDLGTSSVAITAEKIAKIAITSSTLALALYTGTTYYGYGQYKVYDQYGNDITTTTLASSLVPTTSIGDVTFSKGIITVKPTTGSTVPLSSYTSCTLNVYDSNTYVNATATLTVSQTSGVLKSLTFGTLTSPDGDSFNAGDAAGTFYLSYTALDSDGNPTTSYQLLKAAISSINAGANTYIKPTIEQDDTDSNKGVIKVSVIDGNTLYSDMQVPITAILSNGTSATTTVTLKKAATLATFAMSAPSSIVATGETVAIPFTAYDQNGKAITSYSTLSSTSNLTISESTTDGSFKFVKNADGTATLDFTAPAIAETIYLTSVVPGTGKNSQINVTVNAAAYPVSVKLDSTVVKKYMEVGSSQSFDFNVNHSNAGLTCLDQYGRSISLGSDNTYAGKTYRVIATDVAGTVAANKFVDTTDYVSTLGQFITIKAPTTAQTETVTFTLQSSTTSFATTSDVDTKTTSFTAILASSIVGAKSNAVDPLYAYKHSGASLATQTYYESLPTVYGTTSAGSLVVLKSTDLVKSASAVAGSFELDGSYNVSANDTDDATSTGTLTQVVVVGSSTYSAQATLNATDASPVAKSIAASVTANDYGTTTVDGDTITSTGVSISGTTITTTTANLTATKSLQQYSADGATKYTVGNLYFYAVDQYNETNPQAFSYIGLTKVSGTGTLTANSTTGILSGAAAANDQYTLTLVTQNGLTSTYLINVD